MEEHAFDGFDIDWEYPGAPNRRGSPDDVDNFVLLMKAIREAFNRSPRNLVSLSMYPLLTGICVGSRSRSS